MASIQNLSRALVAAIALAPTFVQALILRADFTGTASAQQLVQWPPRPPSYYDGAAVTGSFEVEIVDPYFQVGGDDYAYYYNLGSQRLSYTIRDQQFDLFSQPDDPGVMLLSRGETSESINFQSNIFPKYHGGSFEIRGPAGSLYDGLDPTSLHLEPGVNYGASTWFAHGPAGMYFGISLDQVSLRVLAPVPEPSIALMLLGGAAALAWQRRRRSSAEKPAL